jgi:energy-coupling factor transporter ATP-binding protein EcfA2
MTHDANAPLDIADVVDRIGSMVERALTADNEADLLGPDLHRLRTEHGLPRRMVVIGALLNDFARVAHSCIVADGQITDDELEQVYPIFFSLTSFLAKVRPAYEAFAGFDQDEMGELLAQYAADTEPFGARDEGTPWVGLDVCRRTARATGDEEPLEIYVRAQQRTMDRVFDLGGLTPAESAARARLDAMMELRRRLVEAPRHQGPDPRLTAFCDPSGPPVFSAIAHAHQVWERDPFDVETVHADAREVFERLVDRVATPEADDRGRILVLRGPSGAGKTHLMRAFRGYLHGRRRGFAAYMQMTTRTDDYARYVLVNVIDALERPYDPPEVEASGLITLSDALAEDRRAITAEALQDLREGDFDLQRNDKVSPLVDELLGQAEYQDFDPDLLRVLLYLQRREHRIRARVLKYLRCEHLNDYDSRLLGGMAPRTDQDAPLRMVEQLGRLMSRLRRSAFVLLIDQMEDVFNLDEAGLRVARSVDVLRHVVDHVPTAVVVLSCLQDFYEQVRVQLTRSALDRLESDPPPLTLNAGRSLEDILQIVGVRLEYLYDRMGVRSHDDDPTFPIRIKDLESLVNTRTRDVLKWCREYQERCIEERTLPDAPGGPTMPAPDDRTIIEVTRLGQAWNDFRTSFTQAVPEDDDALLELLTWAATCVGQELAPPFELGTRREGPALVIIDGDRPLVVGMCNRDARGGGLQKQLDALRQVAGSRPVGIVRCSEYPDNPRTLVFKQIGKMVSKGGRRVTVEDGDWRAMMAFRVFGKRHGKDPSFAQWRQDERPLAQLASLRSLLDLEGRPSQTVVEPPFVVAASVAAVGKAESPRGPVPSQGSVEPVQAPRPPELTPPATPTATATPPFEEPALPSITSGTPIIVGRTAGLTSHAVTMDLGGLVTHAAFLGSTGSGKTTLALNLIEQALEQGIPALLLDRKGDLCTYARPGWWRAPARDPMATARKQALADRVRVEVFTPGAPDGRDLGLSVVPTGLSEMTAQERAQTCRQAAAAIGTMLGYKSTGSDLARQSVLAKALEVLGQVTTTEIGFERIVSLIADEDPSLVNAVGRLDTKHFGKLVDHLETLRLTKGELLSNRAELLDPAKLLGVNRSDGKVQLGIVSTKFLGDNASIDFWVARMLSELARWASRNPSRKLQALVLFDEADIYMPAMRKPATKEPMQDLLRRARSAGLGVMLATQSPGDLDYKSRDNIRSWFLGRVAENTAIAKMQPLLSESRVNVKGKLARQSIGEFFMLQGGAVSEIKADRSLMDTEQLAEDEIRELAHRGAPPTGAGRPA